MMPEATPASKVPLGPVGVMERVQFLDVLRGMALLGILTANMRGFFAPIEVYF